MQVQSITSTGKYSQTSKGAFYEIFSAMWGKKLWRKIGIKFFDTWNFQKHRSSPTKFFFTVRQKKFDEKWWNPENSTHSSSIPETPKGPPLTKFFCDTKNFRQKIIFFVIPHSIYSLPKISRPTNGKRQKFSETLEIFQRKIRAKIKNRDTPPYV